MSWKGAFSTDIFFVAGKIIFGSLCNLWFLYAHMYLITRYMLIVTGTPGPLVPGGFARTLEFGVVSRNGLSDRALQLEHFGWPVKPMHRRACCLIVVLYYSNLTVILC